MDSTRMTRSEICNPHILEFGSKVQNQVLGSLPLCLSNGKSWAMVKVLSPLSLVWTGPLRTSYAKAGYWILGAAWPQTESRLKGNDSLGTFHASKKVWSK